MITLKHLNIVRVVDTEEKAKRLEEKGFRRVSVKKTPPPAVSEKAKEENQDGGNDKPDSRRGKMQPEADGGTSS